MHQRAERAWPSTSHAQILPGWPLQFPFLQPAPLLLPEGDEAASGVTLPAEPWEPELPSTGHSGTHVPEQEQQFGKCRSDANGHGEGELCLPHPCSWQNNRGSWGSISPRPQQQACVWRHKANTYTSTPAAPGAQNLCWAPGSKSRLRDKEQIHFQSPSAEAELSPPRALAPAGPEAAGGSSWGDPAVCTAESSPRVQGAGCLPSAARGFGCSCRGCSVGVFHLVQEGIPC